MTAGHGGDAGFSLAETLVATLLLLVVTGAVFALVMPASGAAGVQPHVADLQQRLRVAAAAIDEDLVNAGAAPYGAPFSGGLTDYVAAVRPYRDGSESPDPPGTFRPDVLTVMTLPADGAHARVERVRTGPGPGATLDQSAACGNGRSTTRCGFEPRMRVLLYDHGARWHLGTVTEALEGAVHVEGARPLDPMEDGGLVTEIRSRTYYLRHDVPGRTAVLMRYDGLHTSMPVVEDVVALEFMYWGAAAPPALVPGLPADLRRTTYGPPPPQIGARSGYAWPDGENCTFAIADGAHVPRLARLAADASALTPLGAAALTDGPWCPDAVAPDRFDADLLRIRRIDVRLRVQASVAWLRGRAASLFVHPGTAPAAMQVPDVELTFTVSPRNVGLVREW